MRNGVAVMCICMSLTIACNALRINFKAPSYSLCKISSLNLERLKTAFMAMYEQERTLRSILALKEH